MYKPPEHLVLHHNHVTEGLAGALVGVITLKDPQLSPLSIQLLFDPGSAFEVKTTCVRNNVREQFSIECRKAINKGIALASYNRPKHPDEPK